MTGKGFTLIELLVVVIIMGVLTSLALPQYRRAVKRAQIVEVEHMLRVIYDSSERLAAFRGYKDYQAMDAAGVVTFDQLDMFDTTFYRLDSTRLCELDPTTGTSMTCKKFTYRIGPDSVTAEGEPEDGAVPTFLLDRDELRLRCTTDIPEKTQKICDAYGVEALSESGGASAS